jgi:hypothetical protein
MSHVEGAAPDETKRGSCERLRTNASAATWGFIDGDSYRGRENPATHRNVEWEMWGL